MYTKISFCDDNRQSNTKKRGRTKSNPPFKTRKKLLALR